MAKKVAAAILAGGNGSRFAGETPKQFVTLCGKPVIDYAVQAFSAVDTIDTVYVVVPASYHSLVVDYQTTYDWKRVSRILVGGQHRADSTIAALNAAISDGIEMLLLHDAARPIVKQQTILDVIDALQRVPAATAAISATDTIAVADDAKRIQAIPRRDTLWHVQTPQGFHTDVLRKAYDIRATMPDAGATDDCGVVRAYLPDVPIEIVEGSRHCMKLTYPADLLTLSAWIEKSHL